MLLVKTYIGKSDISGIGLFAAEPIKKGQAIWIWSKDDIMYSYENTKVLGERIMRKLEHFAYTENGNYKLCYDDAKYMNHSDTPNTESFNSEFEEIEITNKDIEIGEELTVDYFKINDDYSREIFKYLKQPK